MTASPASPAPLDATALLKLIWLASPVLPVGGFSYSEGLEAAVDAGLVRDEAAARRWLVDQLRLGLARSDLPVVADAIRAWRGGNDNRESPQDGHADLTRIEALNTWVRTTRETQELRQQTEQMGRSLHEWLRIQQAGAPGMADEHDHPADPRIAQLGALKPAPTWPVAHALALARSGAPLQQALLAHGFGWAENMVQAALKAVPLGQSAGQRILAALVDALPAAIDHAMTLDDQTRQAHTPMLAILSARHEAQYSRLFRS
ncbi:urease accessory protein UreF [Sphaerotilus mobilis]|uniref:Urease accessory protein UreF n=1 Tax=Sphaerotilus mobilis TaxID=47994 RepID=A0A4Q7LDE7_9BURK|nr:urease accessory protein UreF [Sphaerotilus mobilis]RZS52074.1 urease accessory protein [Sphaerotilus mobilis]